MSVCQKCKYAKAMMGYSKDGLVNKCICICNEECYTDITDLFYLEDFISCESFKHYDKNIEDVGKEDYVESKLSEYDYSKEGIKDVDCTKCCYFYGTSIEYPSGKCMLRENAVGIGKYCDRFGIELPKMDVKLNATLLDIQKLAIQYDIKKREDNNDK